MSSKRPIKAFYVSKKKPTSNSSRTSNSNIIPHKTHSSPVVPSFAVIDEIRSPDPPSYSPFGRISQISNFSQRENTWNSSKKKSSDDSSLSENGIEDEEENFKTCIFIIIGLLVAACLIAVVALLTVMVVNKSKGNIRLTFV
ncbi:unnamed protein product [Rotaria sp. Silwood1]|nr:unnamed protein product [Rotaria sp. Silwood1]CAF1225040.1 unnamed protein product [Rotaria sp. Silwood1]CAF3566285.1 unnamed protein product [Rotaria sp. Silwood1]CAF3722234.1 unnamed protein product [Rotaria sp. Silwood1]CAF4859080.1 unnamed protein product [Rotaria sp. Silwood1]